jgi:serine/threonine protein kinase
MHTLGSGAFAVVKLATHVSTGRRVALKIYSVAKIDNRIKREAIEQEIFCMKQLASSDCFPKLYADF